MHASRELLPKKLRGLTMIELLVVVTIISVLLILTVFFAQGQLGKARDAKRKSDLDKIKVAFEHYYSDNGCYPEETVLDTCAGDALQPYLTAVPCDPATEQPYLYKPQEEGAACPNAFRVYAALENTSDPVIPFLDCDGECGCGYGPEYVYGTADGVPVSTNECMVELDASPTPSPSSSNGGGGGNGGGGSPSPSPSGNGLYVFACDSQAETCQVYDINSPLLLNCPATFPDEESCETACAADPETYACAN